MSEITSTVRIADWRKMDREELHELVAGLVDAGSLRENCGGDFDEAVLSALWKTAQAREIQARVREDRACDAWHETLKGNRTSARAAMHAAKARIVYDRARRAAAMARNRERAAWDALDAFWKARRP